MISWAFIFELPEMDSTVDRMVVERDDVRTVIVGVPEPAAVVAVAVALVEEGAQFIELCGGFDPIWPGRVMEATGGRVPVGAVGYAGGASVTRLAEIFAPPA